MQTPSSRARVIRMGAGTIGESYSRLQRVGIGMWDDLGWFSFCLVVWAWRTVIFQFSGFHSIYGAQCYRHNYTPKQNQTQINSG